MPADSSSSLQEGKSTQETLTPKEQECELAGILERIVFYNEENAYAVLKLSADKTCDVQEQEQRGRYITCVGSLIEPRPFMHLRLFGKWTRHPRFGEQFTFTRSEEIFPSTIDGIKRYLSSGIIRGVSKKLTQRIIETFGQNTLTVLDCEPKRLLEIEGIGKKTYKKIRQSWAEHTYIRDLVFFLQPYDISVALAARILLVLGENALSLIKANPYCLATKISGISFEKADALAMQLGFPKDSPLRFEACIIHALTQASFQGHVFLPRNRIKETINALDGVENGIEEKAFSRLLAHLEEEEDIVCEERVQTDADEKKETENAELDLLPPWEAQPQKDESASAEHQTEKRCQTTEGDHEAESAVYLKRFYLYETKTTEAIIRLLCSPKSISFSDPREKAESIIKQQPITLDPVQSEAVIMAAESKILVITGGPGTGKTTIIRTILKLFNSCNAKIQLAAPTGRAARRMQEATHYPAKTIHRLLEFSSTESDCTRNEEKPLACDVLIIDEASMMDAPLFYHLITAVPLGCTVIIVGDIFQLPSVGPGSVLSDIIASGTVPVVKLTTIFRQSAESAIVRYAHAINEGRIPDLLHDTEKKEDFYFIEINDPQCAADTITDLVVRRLPNYYHLNPRDIQVLSPMHKGEVGVFALNQKLQEALNPNGFAIKRLRGSYRLNDRVMQIRNDYDKEVFNGDIGTIIDIDAENRTLKVLFEESVVEYDFNELDDLITSYAISIHKSQGSEYTAVVIPVMTCHWWMLQRNLLYTAITRGKKLVVLVGERRAFQRAIENTVITKRLTKLQERLKKAYACLA